MAWKLKCMVCDKKESFGDAKDITYSKWKIIAWALHQTGEPLVVCPEHDYPLKPKKKYDN